MMRRIAAARAGLGGVFSWWIQELRDTRVMVAERYGPTRATRFQLQLYADHAELMRIGEGTGERRSFKFDGNRLPALEEVWSAEQPRNAGVEIVLRDAEVLTFELQLPPLSDHELGDAVELQLERKLPLPRELLHVAWEVARKLPDGSRIVAVAAARRTQIDAWKERLHAWGWRVVRVCCKTTDGAIRFNFLPRRVQRISFAIGRRERLLAYGAAGLAVSYCLVTVGQWAYERAALRDSIQEARARMAQVEELRAVLARDSGPLVSLQKVTQSPTASSALVALSAALPSDTWLYQTEIRAVAPAAPSMTLEGYTTSTTTLVQALEQAEQFDSVQLVESSATDLGSAQNRIKLKAQLRESVRP